MSKKLVSLLLIFFILGLSTGAFATANLQEIKAFLNPSLKLKLDGKDFVPTRSDGKIMYPIVYNNSSYLPVRAIAKALGVAVYYDTNTKTIYIGERNKIVISEKDYMNLWSSQYSIDNKNLNVNNKTYDYGIIFNGTSGHAEFSFFINPEAKYQKFGGTICFQDSDKSTEEVTIKIRENDHNGTVLKEIKAKAGQSIDFEIDISNIKTLYIQNLVYDRLPKSTQPEKLILAEPYFR